MTVHAQEIRVPSTRKIALREHNDICAGLNCPNFLIFSIYQYSHNTTEPMRNNNENCFFKKNRPKFNI